MENWEREWVDYFEELGVSPRATPGVIRAAYRAMAKEFHPDRSPTNVKRMQRINEAFGVLSDPARRQQYDDAYQLRNRPAPAQQPPRSQQSAQAPPPSSPPRDDPKQPPRSEPKPPSSTPPQEESARRENTSHQNGSSEEKPSPASVPTDHQFDTRITVVLVIAAAILVAFWALTDNEAQSLEPGLYRVNQPISTSVPGWDVRLSEIHVFDGGEMVFDVAYHRTVFMEGFITCPERVFLEFDSGERVMTVDNTCHPSHESRMVGRNKTKSVLWAFPPLDDPTQRFSLVLVDWGRLDDIALGKGD